MGKEEESLGFRYWIRWQVFVCAFIVIAPAMTSVVFLLRRRVAGNLKACDLWRPYWRNLQPKSLLIYRVCALASLALLFAKEISVDGIFGFYFYTQWTFTLVIVYFMIAVIASIHGCLYSKRYKMENEEQDEFLNADMLETAESKPSLTPYKSNTYLPSIKLRSHSKCNENEQSAGCFGHVMQIVYQSCAGAVMLTDSVFWCLLVPFYKSEHFNLSMVAVSMHSLNAICLILDTVMNSLPFPWFGFFYFILWSSCYVVFQWTLHACGFSWWPYPFLELSTPWAPLWYLSIALVHVMCYGLYMLVMEFKNDILPKLCPLTFVKSSN